MTLIPSTNIPIDRAAPNHSYQNDLANSLIESLGVDQAIEACRRNLWSGVQEIILHERSAAPSLISGFEQRRQERRTF